MRRVYSALKARILAGDFMPGERLDPARLASEHVASVTPVRDALHQLTGERLIESWQHEGFRQPLISEAGLRDLYGWSSEVVGLALRAAGQRHTGPRPPPAPDLDAGGGYAGQVAQLFNWIAIHSANREHLAAIDAINARCHRVRLIEIGLLSDPRGELEALQRAVAQSEFSSARRLSDAFHRHRLRLVPAIAEQLRPREGD